MLPIGTSAQASALLHRLCVVEFIARRWERHLEKLHDSPRHSVASSGRNMKRCAGTGHQLANVTLSICRVNGWAYPGASLARDSALRRIETLRPAKREVLGSFGDSTTSRSRPTHETPDSRPVGCHTKHEPERSVLLRPT